MNVYNLWVVTTATALTLVAMTLTLCIKDFLAAPSGLKRFPRQHISLKKEK